MSLWWQFLKPLPAHAAQANKAVNTGANLGLYGLLFTAVAGAFAYVYSNKNTEPPEPKLYGKWQDDVPADEGYSHELVSLDALSLVEKGQADLEKLDVEPFPGVDTVFKAMNYNLDKRPEAPILGSIKKKGGDYVWLSWKQAMQKAKAVAAGMERLGMVSEVEAEGTKWRFFGIQSKNCEEWSLCNMAGMFRGMTSVGLFDSLGQDALQFICRQTQLKTIVVERGLVKQICDWKKTDPEGLQHLQNLVVIGDESNLKEDVKKAADDVDVKLMSFEDLVKEGQKEIEEKGFEVIEPKAEDVYMLSYTSGTTGNPKGVKLTHKMILNASQALNKRMDEHPQGLFGPDDSYLSYLPLAHSFEQVMQGTSLIYAMKCGFYSGNLLSITSDLEKLKPTAFPSVPSFFNRIYGRIQKKFNAETGLKKQLIDYAVETKLRNLRNGKGLEHPLFDKLIFNKTKDILGGETRVMISGSAPISVDVLDFLKICFITDIANGYGMTEGCGAMASARLFDPQSGHIGGPLQNTRVRLRDLPDMGYTTSGWPKRGDLCFQGSSITKGYFDNEEKTSEQFVDGWLLSGDVGEIDKNGKITIIDRVKNIFKLANGEYVAPEKVENVFVQSEWVLQCWVYGDSLKDYAVAFIVVDPEKLSEYAKENNLDQESDQIMENAKLKQEVFNSITYLANDNNLTVQEKPKQIQLVKDQFSPANGLLTPTMKMKRNVLEDKYKTDIEALYDNPKTMIAAKKTA